MMNKHEEEKKMILEENIIEPGFMNKTIMRGHKPYSHICQASLTSFFTKESDIIFPNLVQEFNTNLNILGKTLTSSGKKVKIITDKERFGRTFEITFLGTSYNLKNH